MALSYRALVLGEPRTSPPLFRVSDLAGGRRAAAAMSLRPCTAPRNPGFVLNWPYACYLSLLVPESRPCAAHSPHTGETRRPGPPSSPTTPLRASPNPNNHPGGLRMPRTPSTTKRQPEWTLGAPDWLSPVLLRRGKSLPAAFRRRPARPSPLAARSGSNALD